jgi:hypothetical protein
MTPVDQAPTPWDKRRGLENVARNQSLLLLRSDVETVGKFVAANAVRWERDVLGQTVCSGACNILLFRVRGQSWAIALGDVLELSIAVPFSREFHSEAIEYQVSDTCASIGYSYFRDGELLEELFCEMGAGNRPRRRGSKFNSKIRNLRLADIKDGWAFVDQFFRDHDAYEPSLSYEYFLHRSKQPQQATIVMPGTADIQDDRWPRICNPGWATRLPNGHEIVSIPDLERVDFIVLREGPNQSGRILLG